MTKNKIFLHLTLQFSVLEVSEIKITFAAVKTATIDNKEENISFIINVRELRKK